jgi:pyruvate,water dikinase
VLHQEQYVTVSCAEGDEGFVYEGIAEVIIQEMDVTAIPSTRTKIMLNLANPAAAFRWWRLPADGVGLARMEFVIANHVKVHPMALVHFDRLTHGNAMTATELTRGYEHKADYFVDRLAGSRIAAAVYPKRS